MSAFSREIGQLPVTLQPERMFFFRHAHFPGFGIGLDEVDIIHRGKIGQACQFLKFFTIGNLGDIEQSIIKWL
jgi:hypothetical protein